MLVVKQLQDSKISYLEKRKFEYYGRVCFCRERERKKSRNEMNIQFPIALEEITGLIGKDTRKVEPSLARE